MKQVITVHPNRELFQKTKEIPIKDIHSETFSQIGSSMLAVLKDTNGVGLSANQLGLTFKMCVIQLIPNDPKILLNPRIVKMSDTMIDSREGCLSLPGGDAKIIRHSKITVDYEDVKGETQSIEATGLMSCCLQHEIDHLNGILIINRLNEFYKSKVLKQVYKFRRGTKRSLR